MFSRSHNRWPLITLGIISCQRSLLTCTKGKVETAQYRRFPSLIFFYLGKSPGGLLIKDKLITAFPTFSFYTLAVIRKEYFLLSNSFSWWGKMLVKEISKCIFPEKEFLNHSWSSTGWMTTIFFFVNVIQPRPRDEE